MSLALQLMTGVDIPIPECCLTLHQPTIKEISYIGEKTFFTGAQCLCLNKTMYTQSEELKDISNFAILISLLNEKQAQEQKNCTIQVLQLLFPAYKIFLTPRAFMFNLESETFMLDESNFDSFQQVCRQVFCLNKTDQNTFNPANAKAKQIADKLMEGRKKVAALKAEQQGDTSALAQYLSILTVGLSSMSLNDLMNLTMFQLYNLIERYSLYLNWDIDLKARMAGAKPDKEADSWMKSIH